MTKYEQVRQFLIGEKIKKLKAEQKVMEVRLFVEEAKRKQAEYELRYNHNHDPKNGRFTSGSSGKAVDKNAGKMYHDSGDDYIPITAESIDRVAKPDIFADDELNVRVQELCKSLLTEAADDPHFTERAYSVSLADLQNGAKNIQKVKGGEGEGTVTPKSLDEPYLSIHNHPSGGTISTHDGIAFCLDRHAEIMIVTGNNGNVYALIKTPGTDTTSALPKIFEKSTKDSDVGLNAF